ncbi:rRNA maturation RNase YbeY [Azospirillum griseum]|nr:rRNA maturation RNase YbeY [Azospirillum griseum]
MTGSAPDQTQPDHQAMPELEIAVSREAGDWPDHAETLVERVARATLAATYPPDDGPAELSLVLADNALVQQLNRDYRGKDKPTNVLSFALTEAEEPDPEEGAPVLLGDVILAYETVQREAAEQNKSPDDHLSHLVMHGVLHLLGYDHETDDEAEEMEALETRLLASLGIADPYADNHEPPDQ